MRYFRIIILITVICSCEEQIEFDFPNESSDLIVVEGMITNEKKDHQVKLSRLMTDPNKEPVPVTGAVVAITDQEEIFVCTEDPAGSGKYFTAPDVRGVFGTVYYLYIKHNEKEYLAAATMEPVSPLSPAEFRLVDQENKLYEFLPENDDNPHMTEIFLEWSQVSEHENKPGEPTHAQFTHYQLNSIDVNEIYKPVQENIYFPEGTRVIRKKYSLSYQHQVFLRGLLSETRWRGGLFDVKKGNAITNLSEGAIGFFAASTVTIDTTFVEGQ